FEFVQAGEIGSQTESGLAIWHWDPAITYVPDVPAAFRTALPYKVDFPGLIRVMDASAIVPDFKLVTFVSELSPGLEITASMQMGAPATATWSMVNFGLAEPYTTGLIPISAEQSPGFIGWGTTTARSTATANALMMRDSFGRSKIVDPAAPDDIASKGYVDRIAAVGYTTPIPVSGTQSLASWTQSMVIHWNLLGNVTVSTMPTVLTPGMTISLVLTQDATGGRTLTLPATVKLPSALPLPLTAAAGGVDVVHLWWTGAVWIGALAGRDLR
ncbi:hypothetical protein, partial [uncultured Microbacterium sp.]|uniref:hypothetical protein n=1 Tax=uncultured Microbacterium sp. TaxID=191216 RepID=UPI0025E477BD